MKYQNPIKQTNSKKIPKKTTPKKKKQNKMKKSIQKINTNIHINHKLKNLENLTHKHNLNNKLKYQKQQPYKIILNSYKNSTNTIIISNNFIINYKIHFPYYIIKQTYINKNHFKKNHNFIIHISKLKFFIFNKTFILQQTTTNSTTI